MKRRTNFDPHGNINGHHRKDEHRKWHFDYSPISLADIKPFQILVCRAKSMISATIVAASLSDGHAAWLSHCGQILPWCPEMKVPRPSSGLIVSEATFPRHSYTPIEHYLKQYTMDNTRLTILKLRDGVYQTDEIKHIAERKCQLYHNTLIGAYYEVPGLLVMLMTSILRNSNPFLKKGKWISIPEEKAKQVMICSAEVDYGWAWLQREINHDLFPSSLSLSVSSPQDIYDSPDTAFVAGTRKIWDN